MTRKLLQLWPAACADLRCVYSSLVGKLTQRMKMAEVELVFRCSAGNGRDVCQPLQEWLACLSTGQQAIL